MLCVRHFFNCNLHYWFDRTSFHNQSIPVSNYLQNLTVLNKIDSRIFYYCPAPILSAVDCFSWYSRHLITKIHEKSRLGKSLSLSWYLWWMFHPSDFLIIQQKCDKGYYTNLRNSRVRHQQKQNPGQSRERPLVPIWHLQLHQILVPIRQYLKTESKKSSTREGIGR